MTPSAPKALLIATWKIAQDLTIDHPSTIRWADGDPASFDDYLTYSSATHTFVVRKDGVELHMYPAVVGDVSYDLRARRWIMNLGVAPGVFLDVADPSAPDDQILAELFTYPVIYRVRIHR